MAQRERRDLDELVHTTWVILRWAARLRREAERHLDAAARAVREAREWRRQHQDAEPCEPDSGRESGT